jgi:hypothetical protein
MLALALLSGCERAEPRLELKPEPTKPEPPKKPCLTDEVGELSLGWEKRPECTPEDTSCRDGCFNGDRYACFARAIAIEPDRSKEAEVVDLFKRACRLGLALGCTNWGAHQWSDATDGSDHRTPRPGIDASKDCVLAVFNKACGAKEVLACGMLGRMGVEFAKNPTELARGKALLESSCTEFKGPPCRMLAYYIEKGKFGPPDRSRIKALMTSACEGGDKDACGEHATVDETFLSR